MGNYNDGIGNYFLGEVSLSGADPISDTPLNQLSTDLSAILTNSSARFRNLPSNSDFGSLANSCNIHFGANADTIDDRILFVTGQNTGSAGAGVNDNRLFLFNDTGSTVTITLNTTGGSTNLTNQIFKVRNLVNSANGTVILPNWNTTSPSVYCCGVSDGESIGLVQFALNNANANTDFLELKFWYAGLLQSPEASLNTTSKQYITLLSTCFLYTGSFNRDNAHFHRKGRVFLTNETFNNTQASYTFTCADSTIPTKQWVKDFEVKNGSTVMGTARNLLIGTGSYPLLIPITIDGTGGLETWLPVCHYGDPLQSAYTILMRCKGV
jgi:hypothetical protein